MGEMADFVNDTQWDDEWEPEQDDDSVPGCAFMSCRYCSNSELMWGQLPSGQFRLFDTKGNVHSCRQYHQ